MQRFIRKNVFVLLTSLLIPLTACAAGHGKKPPHDNGDVKFSVEFRMDGSLVFRDRNGRPLKPRSFEFPLEVNTIEAIHTIVDVKKNPCWAIYNGRLVEYC